MADKRPKYAILLLTNIRLVKCETKDELEALAQDLKKDDIPFEAFKDHGEIYAKMEQFNLD